MPSGCSCRRVSPSTMVMAWSTFSWYVQPASALQGVCPLTALQTIIEKKQVGLPENLRQQDEEKWAVLVGHARGILTNRKSEIKKAVRDIISLSCAMTFATDWA